MPRPSKFSPTDLSEMERLYRAGHSIAGVAERFGCHPTSVLERLRNRGVPMRKPWEPSPLGSRNPKWITEEQVDEMVRLNGEGLYAGEIAKRMGLRGSGTVVTHLRARGLQTKGTRRGDRHPQWRGGRTKTARGYIWIKQPDHPRAATSHGYVLEHVLVAERALGKALPDHAVIHHVNGDKADNRPANLVICEDQAYHLLLHRRERAIRAKEAF